jgi:NADH-quinone oxidoreductase subunit J
MLEIILTSPTFLIAILLIAFLASSLLVLITKSLIWIITFIGVGSVLLSIIFFVFGAPFAGAFELSVGAGLISVLFIIATSLTRQSEENIE